MIVLAAPVTQDESSSLAWLWISMLVISLSAIIVASLYVYQQKRIHNTNFNINVSFRNNEIVNDFAHSFAKTPTPSPFTRQLPKVIGLIPKGFEVINDDHNENHFLKSDDVQNYSEEEYLADAEFQTVHDQSTRLIN